MIGGDGRAGEEEEEVVAGGEERVGSESCSRWTVL